MLCILKSCESEEFKFVSAAGTVGHGPRARFTKNWPNRGFIKILEKIDKPTIVVGGRRVSSFRAPLLAPEITDLSFHIRDNLLDFQGPHYTKTVSLVNRSSKPIDFMLQPAPYNFFSVFPVFGSLQPRGSVKVTVSFQPRLQSWGSDGKEVRGYLRVRSLNGFPMERVELRAFNGPLLKIQSPSLNFGYCALGKSFDLPIFTKGIGLIPTLCVAEIVGPDKHMFTISPMQATVYPGKTHEFLVTFLPHQIAGFSDDPDAEEENVVDTTLPKSSVFTAYLHFLGQGGETYMVQLNGIEGKPLKINQNVINFGIISDPWPIAEEGKKSRFAVEPEVVGDTNSSKIVVLENTDPFYSLPVCCSSSDEQLTWSQTRVVLPPSSKIELTVAFAPMKRKVIGGQYLAYLMVHAPKCDPIHVKVTAFVGDFLTFGSAPVIYLPPMVPGKSQSDKPQSRNVRSKDNHIANASKVVIPLFNHSSFDMKVCIDGLKECVSAGILSFVVRGESGEIKDKVTGHAMYSIGTNDASLYNMKANTQAMVELWYHGASAGYFEMPFWVETKAPFVARYGPWTLKSATLLGASAAKRKGGVSNLGSKREVRSALTAITEDGASNKLSKSLVGDSKVEGGLQELRGLLSVPVQVQRDRRGTKHEGVGRRRSRRFSLEGGGTFKQERKSTADATTAGSEKGVVSVSPNANVLLMFEDMLPSKALASRYRRDASTSFVIHNGNTNTSMKYELFVSKPLYADVPLSGSITSMQSLKVTLCLRHDKKVRASSSMQVGFVSILDVHGNMLRTYQVHIYPSNAIDVHLESERKAVHRSHFFPQLLDLVDFGETVMGSKQRKRLRISNLTMYPISLTAKIFVDSPNMGNGEDESPKVFCFENNSKSQLQVVLDAWQQFDICLVFMSTVTGKFQWFLQVEHQIVVDGVNFPNDKMANTSCKCLRGTSCEQSNLQIQPRVLDFGSVPLKSCNEKAFSIVNHGFTIASSCVLVSQHFSISRSFAAILPKDNLVVGNQKCEGSFGTNFMPPAQGQFGETAKFFHGDKAYILSLMGSSGIVELTSDQGCPYSKRDPNIINLGIVNTLESEQISLVVTNVGSLAAVIKGVSSSCDEILCSIIPESNILRAPSSTAKISEQDQELMMNNYNHGETPKDAIELLGDLDGNSQSPVLDWDEIFYQQQTMIDSDDPVRAENVHSEFPVTIKPGHSVTIFLTFSLRTVCKKIFDVILNHCSDSVQSTIFRMSGTFQPSLSWVMSNLNFGTIPSKSTKRLKTEFLNEGLAGVSVLLSFNMWNDFLTFLIMCLGVMGFGNITQASRGSESRVRRYEAFIGNFRNN
jgi:hypothetical protein